MRKLALLVLAAAFAVAPRAASAGFFIEGSLGWPWHTNPSTYREPTNIMVTPGFEIVWVSAELGILGAFAQFDQPGAWSLRPMVGLRPPAFPLYGKLIFDIHDLSGGTVTSVGGALGAGINLAGLGIFLEGDYIPRQSNGENLAIWEIRLGVSFGH
ncbi:MAG TPA: hypothetical protein VFR85_05325 [Anaeromyxobacteraceae bacterium]|nr:hypothetical protein [Anaeromyxobacteraceae bacterium]